VIWIPVLIVYSSELSSDACCLIEDVVVFINKDVTPVRYLNSLLYFSEDWKCSMESVVYKKFII
jgi:hypothetical protein